jgi:hypothetical protein
MEKKNIIELEIIEEMPDSGAESVSLVDYPAIEHNWMFFKKEEFVLPVIGETKDHFLNRCMDYVVGGESKNPEQGYAICNSLWSQGPTETYDFNTNQNSPIYPFDQCVSYQRRRGLSDDSANGVCGWMKEILKDDFKYENLAKYPWDKCIADRRSEGKSEDAANNICGWIKANMQMEFSKVSFDWDDTLSTAAGKAMFKEKQMAGDDLYIITARSTPGNDIRKWTSSVGLPMSKVFATGSNEAKVAKVKELNIEKHIDNNPDVIKSLGTLGVKFGIDTGGLAPYTQQTGTPLKRKAVFNSRFETFADESQRILVGPVLIPDIEIPRKDEVKGVYFVKFSKEVVAKIAEKFMRELRAKETNIMHNADINAETYVFESWIVEDELTDKANLIYNRDVPKGTWMVKMRVQSDNVWRLVKEDKLNGFSIEGNFVPKEEYDAYIKDKKMFEDLRDLIEKL